MANVCILTSAHSPFDVRIYHCEAESLKKMGLEVTIVAPWKNDKTTSNGIKIQSIPIQNNRFERFSKAGFFLYRSALKIDADIYGSLGISVVSSIYGGGFATNGDFTSQM